MRSVISTARRSPIERVEIFGMFYLTFATAVWIVTKVRTTDDPVRIAVARDRARRVRGRALRADVPSRPHVARRDPVRHRRRARRCGRPTPLALSSLDGDARFDGRRTDHLRRRGARVGWALEALALVCAGLALKDDVLRIGGLLLLGGTFLQRSRDGPAVPSARADLESTLHLLAALSRGRRRGAISRSRSSRSATQTTRRSRDLAGR